MNADLDLDPTFHFDADPDPDSEPTPSFTHVFTVVYTSFTVGLYTVRYGT
jgi:hypothetical protein